MVRIESISRQPTIRIDRHAPKHPADKQECIESAWQQLCNSNPRYFNGKMLCFDSFNQDSYTIYAHVDQYKHHAVRDTINLGIKLLAVTGVLCASDNGHTKYLIGKRSPSTHRYADQWEFGPCGGIDVPKTETNTIGFDKILDELNRESIEEAGINLSGTTSSMIALVHDDAVGSVDIVILVQLPMIPNIQSSWEYTACQWLTIQELQSRIKSHRSDFIPTTIAIAQMLDATNDYD